MRPAVSRNADIEAADLQGFFQVIARGGGCRDKRPVLVQERVEKRGFPAIGFAHDRHEDPFPDQLVSVKTGDQAADLSRTAVNCSWIRVPPSVARSSSGKSI